MEIINVYEKSQNNWTIRPGPVGSVGDANLQVRLRGNTPDSKIRYDKEFSGVQEKYYGSKVQDGSYGAGTARVIDRKFGSRPGHKTSVGWIFQDIIPTDRKSETILQPLGRYKWDNQQATVLRAKVSGEKFLPAPGLYDKSLLQQTQSLARGNQVPRVVLSESGAQPLPSASGSLTTITTNQNAVTNPYQAGPMNVGIPQTVAAKERVGGGILRPPLGKI